MFTEREKRGSTLSIARELLRKSAGKPQCTGGTGAASVNPHARRRFKHRVPNTVGTKGGDSVTGACQLQVCSTFLCEMGGSSRVTKIILYKLVFYTVPRPVINLFSSLK